MQAIRFHQFGPPEVLRLEEAPDPTPGPGEVRIAVRAAGVNPVDWKIRSGAAGDLVAGTLPGIPGSEVSGVIDALGPGVTDWQVGDAVMSFIGLWNAYAERTRVAAELLARKPANISFAQAAGVPLSACTALGALTQAARLQPGQRLLVVGGAGAVGSFAVQLGKAMGATVVASASSRNRDRLRQLGADETIAYDAAAPDAEIAPVDVVLDCVGAEAALPLMPLVAPDGRYIALSFPGDAETITAAGYNGTFFGIAPDGALLRDMAGRIERGEIRLGEPIAMPLAEAAAAQALCATGHAPGHIVLITGNSGGKD